MQYKIQATGSSNSYAISLPGGVAPVVGDVYLITIPNYNAAGVVYLYVNNSVYAPLSYNGSTTLAAGVLASGSVVTVQYETSTFNILAGANPPLGSMVGSSQVLEQELTLGEYQADKALAASVTALGSQAPVSVVTVGASPFAYTATTKGQVVIQGGTVTAVTLTRAGTAVTLGIAGTTSVSANDIITVTYTAAPTMTFIPL